MTISATTQGIKPGVCLSTNRPVNPFDGQVIYMTDVDQTAVWDGSQWTVLAPIAGGRNAFINGAMNVWQRGTSTGTLALGGGGYVGPDRWWYYNNGFTTTISRQACGSTLPQFQYCARYQRTSGQTSTTASVLFSPLETINSVRFAGKQVTVSFYARASSGLSSATALRVFVQAGTGVDQSNFGGAAYTGAYNVLGFTPTLTTSWQRFSSTGTVTSTTSEIGILLQFVPTGTAGASDWFEITGIQLEEGSVATPFEFEDFGTTLAKCQRYFQKSYNQSVNPGTATFEGTVHGTIAGVTNAGLKSAHVCLPVVMRATPTVTPYDTDGNINKFTQDNIGSATTNKSGSIFSPSQRGFSALINNGDTCAAIVLQYIVSAEL
jgi:hypothetical protein